MTPLDSDVSQFLTPGAPHGTRSLNLTRFRKHSAKSAAAAVADDLLGGEGDGEGPRAPLGLSLDWVDGQGRALRSLTLHPVPADVEDQLLPRCVAAAFASGAAVHIIARHAALAASPRIVDTLLPASTPVAASAATHSYREALPPPDSALQELVRSGFQVQDGLARSFHAVRERRRAKNALWLLMLVPILLFAPALVVLNRSFQGVLTMLRTVLENSLRDRTERLSYQVHNGTLRVLSEVRAGHEESLDIELRDVLAVGFGPGNTPVQDSDVGALRVVTQAHTVRVPHVIATPETKQHKGEGRVPSVRRCGHAQRSVLQWLTAAHHA
jgi:hypothetical protein